MFRLGTVVAAVAFGGAAALWSWAEVPWNRFLGVPGAGWVWMLGAGVGGALAALGMSYLSARGCAAAVGGLVAVLVFVGSGVLLDAGLGCWHLVRECTVPVWLWPAASPAAGAGAVGTIALWSRVAAGWWER